MGRLYDAVVEVGAKLNPGDVKKQGAAAGREYGKALADAAAKAAEANVKKLGDALGKARETESVAAGKLAVAEAKLAETRKKYSEGSSQVLAAENALAAAQRKSASTADAATKAAENLEKGRTKAAKSAEEAGKHAGESFNGALEKALGKVDTADEGKKSGDRFGIGFTKSLPGIGGRVTSFFKTGIGAAAGLAAGAVVGGGFLEAFKTALDQGDSSARLTAQLGLADGEPERAGKVAGDLYKGAFGDSIRGVNDAIRKVVQDTNTRISDIKLEEITGKVITLADVFEQDLGAVTRAVGQSIKTGLAKNADEALDIITRGFQGGADKAEDFLDTLNEYGTQFRKVGLDGKTATGLISQGLQAGARDADIVADSIKEFAIRAVDGSKTTSAGFQSLGLDAEKMAARIAKGGKPAAAGLDLVLDRLRKVKDPVKQSQIAVELFGTQAEDLGKALFALDPSTAVDALGRVGGAASDLVNTVGSTPQQTVTAFFRGLKQNSVEGLGVMIQGFTTGETKATGFKGALGQVGVGARTVFDYFKSDVLPRLRDFAGFLKTEVLPRVVEFGGFIRDNVLPPLRDFGSYIADTVAPIVGQFIKDHLASLKSSFESVKKAVQDNKPELERVLGVLQTLAKFVVEQVGPVLGKISNQIFPAIAASITTTITIIGGLVDAFDAVKKASTTVLGFVVTTFLNFVQTITDGAATAFGWVPGLGPKLKSAAADFDKFKTDVNRALSNISDEAIDIKIRYSDTGVNLTTPSSVGRRALGGPGGPVRAPGTGRKTDRAGLYALSDTEWVIQSDATQIYGDQRMAAVNAGIAQVLMPGEAQGFASGGSPGLSLSNNLNAGALAKAVTAAVAASAAAVAKQLAKAGGGLAGAMAFGRAQEGKPYVWGAGGPNGYDCSGYVGALINYARGRFPFNRLGATGSMPWADMAPGDGRFSVGYFKGNPGHTAATINGVNFESRGGRGVVVGSGARGSHDSLFTNLAHVRGFKDGGSPGLQGDLPFDLLDPRGKKFQKQLAEALGVKTFDTGLRAGGWEPGTLAYNGTGKTETVRTAEQESRLGGPLNVRVFIGSKELTDIVRVEMDEKNRQAANSFNL